MVPPTKESSSFLKKRTKRLLRSPQRHAPAIFRIHPPAQKQKSFASRGAGSAFSSEKKVLLML
jgi:hypothetical protein